VALDPDWLDRPAVTRISAASAAALRPFLASYNATRPYPKQIKPFNFLLSVHVAPFSHPTGYRPEHFQLVGRYEPDPSRWLDMRWTDHYSGDSFRIHTEGPPSPDSVKVKTNRDVLDQYRSHPEPKSLGTDGTPCHRRTYALLQRRPVTATEIGYIGKEANRLEETTAGLIHNPGEILNTYNDPALDPWHSLVVPVLRDFNTAEVAARAGVDRRTLQRLLTGHSRPRRATASRLTAVAADLAASALGLPSADSPLATLRAYLDTMTGAPPVRSCPICGKPVNRARATYCSDACKKRAHRDRAASLRLLDP
jgi:predicted nucleic acid-binding Zn ribbon protein